MRKTHFETGSGSGQAPLKNPLPVTCYGPPKLIPVKCSEAFASQQSTKHQILTALKDNQVNMVGVYGMGGVGKTNLMSQIIKDTEISSQFENVLKVNISQNCSLEAIQTEIAEKLGMKFNDTNVTVRAMRLYARLKQAKSLIVLDDMWKELSLAEVGIPHGEDNHGCKVVMTTRSSDLCTRMDVQLSIEVKVLPPNESWELFCQNAGKDVDSNEIQTLAKTIVQECNGLPLAIIVLAKALKGKRRGLWDVALQQLKRSACKDISTALSSIRWSYDYLESKDTKFCFLFCCLFPEDYEISMDELLMYAVGEDILADADTLAEARGRLLQIVENLISSSLLLKCDVSKFMVYEILKCDASKFMMHDIVREAAISIASENGNNFIVKAGMGLSEWPQLKDVGHILRLSLISNNISVLPNQLSCQRLVTLSLARNYNLKRVSDDFFTGMTALTTLDLSKSSISSLPQSLSALTNLRTLNLEGCGSLVDVSMLGCLRNLEILNLQETCIPMLPEELKLLTNLKLLNLSGNYKLETIPPNVISSLSRLEELYLPLEFSEWETEGMEERKNACLSELSSLTALSALHVHTKDISLLYKDPPFKWKNLKEFRIGVIDDEFDDDRCSNSLCISSIAEWVRGLWGRNDLELHVKDCDSFTNVIPVLHSSFNNLKILEIYNCGNMEYSVKREEIGEQAIFTELEKLKLISWNDMKGICSSGPIPIGSFNKLRILEVSICYELVNLFPVSMVESLPQLERLEIFKCDKMVQIWSSGLIPIGSFNKLRILEVFGCDELRYVIPVSMVENLPQLLCLEISDCNEMVQIFGSEEEGCSQPPKIKAVFSQLKYLKLGNLQNLSKFHSQSLVIFSFPSLEFVKIKLCPNLRRVPLGPESAPKVKEELESDKEWQCGDDQSFLEVQDKEVEPICKLRMGSFLSLETVTIRLCPNLRKVPLGPDSVSKLKEINLNEQWQYGDDQSFLESSVIFSFPSLEYVTITSCPNLMRVPLGPESAPNVRNLHSDKEWQCGDDQSFLEVQDEEETEEEECEPMCKLHMDDLLLNLHNLQIVDVRMCNKVEVLFNSKSVQDEGNTGILSELTLSSLPKLRMIWKDSSYQAFPKNLRTIYLYECPKLRYIFSTSMVKSLQQLVKLEMRVCSKTVQIFGFEEVEDMNENINYPHPPRVEAVFQTFSNLRLILFEGCDSLKCLLSISIARGLPLLYRLEVHHCRQMVELFEGCGEEGEDIKVVFPRLEILHLQNLQSFSRFSSQSSVIFSFPSLEKVTIRLCPNLMRVPLGWDSRPILTDLKSDEQWQYGDDQSFLEVVGN